MTKRRPLFARHFVVVGLLCLFQSNSAFTMPQQNAASDEEPQKKQTEEMPAPQSFSELLKESGLKITSNDAYEEVAPTDNPVVPYEHALRHASGDLEIRFIIRPLDRIIIDYSDPHNAAPEPNHLFPLLFADLTARLSKNQISTETVYSTEDAAELFHADWAAAAIFDLNPEFAEEFSQGLLIAIHKGNQADAYAIFLCNDFEKARTLIKEMTGTLKFL